MMGAGSPSLHMTIASNRYQRVLLIDDDDLVVGSLRQYLVTQGFEVDVAVEPHAAEILMRANAYDVIFVDPYLTGAVHTEHSAVLDAVGALQQNAHMIVLTAYSSPQLTGAVSGWNRVTVLSKPQPVVYLSELVANAFSDVSPDMSSTTFVQRMIE